MSTWVETDFGLAWSWLGLVWLIFGLILTQLQFCEVTSVNLDSDHFWFDSELELTRIDSELV